MILADAGLRVRFPFVVGLDWYPSLLSPAKSAKSRALASRAVFAPAGSFAAERNFRYVEANF